MKSHLIDLSKVDRTQTGKASIQIKNYLQDHRNNRNLLGKVNAEDLIFAL